MYCCKLTNKPNSNGHNDVTEVTVTRPQVQPSQNTHQLIGSSSHRSKVNSLATHEKKKENTSRQFTKIINLSTKSPITHLPAWLFILIANSGGLKGGSGGGGGSRAPASSVTGESRGDSVATSNS